MPPPYCRRATLEGHTVQLKEESEDTSGACLKQPDPRLGHSGSLDRLWLFAQDALGPAEWK